LNYITILWNINVMYTHRPTSFHRLWTANYYFYIAHLIYSLRIYSCTYLHCASVIPKIRVMPYHNFQDKPYRFYVSNETFVYVHYLFYNITQTFFNWLLLVSETTYIIYFCPDKAGNWVFGLLTKNYKLFWKFKLFKKQ